MSAAWSDQFSRALCQTVPSPFGLGSSDPEVASCSLHSLSFLCDAVEDALQAARAVWSSRTGPRSTHRGDERQIQSCPPPSPCQAGDEGCTARNSGGGSALAVCWRCHRIGPGHAEVTWRLAGMVFSVVLVALQFGIYLGLENRVAAMLY